MIKVDRSRIVARQECPRLRQLNYHQGGTGIEKVQQSLPLITGIGVHQAIASVLLGEPIEKAITDAQAHYAAEVRQRGIVGQLDSEFIIAEQGALLEGLVRGWCQIRLPALRAEFDIYSVEEEFEWEMAPGLIQMLRMDAVLRHKVEGTLFVLELKTVAWPGYAWMQQWERNIQFMSYTQALREHTGEEVGGVLVEGLVKGGRKLESSMSSKFEGKILQQSPFCQAQKSQGAALFDPKWHKGWNKTAIWEEMPMSEQIHLLDPDILAQQFMSVPPIAPLPEQIVRWRRQTIAAETRWDVGLKEIAAATSDLTREELLDFFAPQHDTHCLRQGTPCAFSECCFNDLVGEDPTGSGLYQARTPHHSTETT